MLAVIAIVQVCTIVQLVVLVTASYILRTSATYYRTTNFLLSNHLYSSYIIVLV